MCTGLFGLPGPSGVGLLQCTFPRAVLAFSFFASTLSIDDRRLSDPLRHPAGAGLRAGRPGGRAACAGDVPVHPRQLPDGYRGRLWTIRQYSGFGTAEESNERYRYLLAQGGTGLSVALDLPTQCGYDSDDPEVEEEVGRVGVALDTLADAEILFDGIPLDEISTSFTINGTAAILLAFYVAVGGEEGRAAREAARHHPERHPQGVRVAAAPGSGRREPSLRLIADTIEFCAAEVPRFNAISVAGAHFRDAGANAVQEMAFTLADGITYCDEVVARGRMTIDKFAPQISFFFYTHGDFFEEIAKYRAGRRRWARIVRERYGATATRPSMFRFGCVCRRRLAVRAAGAEQHRARRLRGDGLGARRRPVDVHRRLGRAVRAPQRGVRHAGAAHAADPGLRDRRGARSPIRSAAPTSSRRSPTPPRRSHRDHGRPRAHGGMVRAIEDGYLQRLIADEAFRSTRSSNRASGRSSA